MNIAIELRLWLCAGVSADDGRVFDRDGYGWWGYAFAGCLRDPIAVEVMRMRGYR